MSIATAFDFETATVHRLARPAILAAGCAALADWLFYGWDVGVSLALFLAVVGIAAIFSNRVRMQERTRIILAGQRQWRGRLAQQPAADIRQFLHDAARPRRYRHGAGDRTRRSGGPWRNDPADQLRDGRGLRNKDSGIGHCSFAMNSTDFRHRGIPGKPKLAIRACLCLAIVVLGLALRRFGFGIGWPAFIVKYGGSRWHVACASAAIAVAVELVRLVHTSRLDDFRLTLAGALLLGRIFSPWNILAYGGGIWLAVCLDRLATPSSDETPPQSPS